MKYSKELAKKIVELWATGEHTITAICTAVEIDRDTFYTWKKKKKAFAKMLEEVEQKRLDKIKEVAVSGLMILLRGKKYEETVTEYVNVKDANGQSKPEIKSQRKTKKVILPNATTVIFTLKNLDNSNFAKSQDDNSNIPPAPVLNIQTIDSKEPMLEAEPENETAETPAPTENPDTV